MAIYLTDGDVDVSCNYTMLADVKVYEEGSNR